MDEYLGNAHVDTLISYSYSLFKYLIYESVYVATINMSVANRRLVVNHDPMDSFTQIHGFYNGH